MARPFELAADGCTIQHGTLFSPLVDVIGQMNELVLPNIISYYFYKG
jgi:hypothetical protein